MAAAARPGPFSTKPVEQLIESADTSKLRRAVGALDLTAFGVGAIIGTGIFVIIGEAIGDSGPAIVLSFVLAGVTCAFSALSYSELASTIPVSGSAYTYSYATMGELVAWIIGWDLILEYGVAARGRDLAAVRHLARARARDLRGLRLPQLEAAQPLATDLAILVACPRPRAILRARSAVSKSAGS